MIRCAKCKKQFSSDVVERHHPDKTGFPDWTINLCANCHRQVTNEQNRQRNKRISVGNAPKWYRELFMVPEELLQRKYDIRVASPRKLFRTLHDYLGEVGYVHEYQPLNIQRAFEGIASFNDRLEGVKEWDNVRRPGLLSKVVGIILCLTIVLIPLGIRLIRKTHYKVVAVARLSIEGEAYLAKARPQELDKLETEEVFDVVSDVRVVLAIGIDKERSLADKGKLTDKEMSEGKYQVAADFQKLQSELTARLSKVNLPQVRAPEIDR